MEPFEPFDAPEPPKKRGAIGPPLAINAGLMLVLYVVTDAQTSGRTGDTALAYFFALVGLLVVNVFVALGAALFGKTQTALGLLFSILVIFLIGLGTCAYSLQNMHVN